MRLKSAVIGEPLVADVTDVIPDLQMNVLDVLLPGTLVRERLAALLTLDRNWSPVLIDIDGCFGLGLLTLFPFHVDHTHVFLVLKIINPLVPPTEKNHKTVEIVRSTNLVLAYFVTFLKTFQYLYAHL